MIERVAYALAVANERKASVQELAKIAIAAMRDPSDELLLAPGEPYRVQKAVHVPISEGIKLRRIAWNKIIDAALKE